MQLPPTAELVSDIEQRQDEVLRSLDELDDQVELALRQCQTHLKLVLPSPRDAA
jgi:hypothetical protein